MSFFESLTSENNDCAQVTLVRQKKTLDRLAFLSACASHLRSIVYANFLQFERYAGKHVEQIPLNVPYKRTQFVQQNSESALCAISRNSKRISDD